MSAYVVFCITEVSDRDALLRYRLEAKSTLIEHTPRFLCGPDIAEVLEGSPVEEAVLLEFDTVDAARAWYRSAEYQAAADIRKQGTKMIAFIVEGR